MSVYYDVIDMQWEGLVVSLFSPYAHLHMLSLSMWENLLADDRNIFLEQYCLVQFIELSHNVVGMAQTTNILSENVFVRSVWDLAWQWW